MNAAARSGFGGMVGITEANPEEEGFWCKVNLYIVKFNKKAFNNNFYVFLY